MTVGRAWDRALGLLTTGRKKKVSYSYCTHRPEPAGRLTLTLHHKLCHWLAAICFNLVVAAVFLRGLVNDQNMFASVLLEAILERLVSCQLHAIFLPAQKFTKKPGWLWLTIVCWAAIQELDETTHGANPSSKVLLLFLELSATSHFVTCMATRFHMSQSSRVGHMMTTEPARFTEWRLWNVVESYENKCWVTFELTADSQTLSPGINNGHPCSGWTHNFTSRGSYCSTFMTNRLCGLFWVILLFFCIDHCLLLFYRKMFLDSSKSLPTHLQQLSPSDKGHIGHSKMPMWSFHWGGNLQLAATLESVTEVWHLSVDINSNAICWVSEQQTKHLL